ncbi:MAG: hypothetical protein MZV64_63445 [Ignavibacteriales bacterium]|nr:hypothetical protein [Ignavibacteriales bacterium]
MRCGRFRGRPVLPRPRRGPGGDRPPRGRRSERPGRMFAREALDLTPDQEKALAEFRKARAGERETFRDEMSRHPWGDARAGRRARGEPGQDRGPHRQGRPAQGGARRRPPSGTGPIGTRSSLPSSGRR